MLNSVGETVEQLTLAATENSHLGQKAADRERTLVWMSFFFFKS